jgi:hypothetical protein
MGLRAASPFVLAAALAMPGAGARAAETRSLNGFALEPSDVPSDEIRKGGPPRDGIPALDGPALMPAAAAPWSDDEPVIGVQLGGESRAYPFAILVWHELVNDVLGEQPILVSYCPLCGTGIVFDRRVGGQTRRFGVSGLLYQSDLLMYDRETESLWSQISAAAVTGPSRGQRLKMLRARIEPWSAWRRRHPDTTVLSPETGHRRRYGESPYGDYAISEDVIERFFPPTRLDRRYHPKMPTLGLRIAGGPARAYPASELAQAGGSASEEFAGRHVRVSYDPEAQVFSVEAPDSVEVIEGFWFAWIAFHPKSSVFRAEGSEP